MISVCGIYCERECYAFQTECPGCTQLEGKVSWAGFLGKDTCPIYTCVIEKKYETCGDCSEIPCRIWLVETKNPSMTDEEYSQDLTRRMNNLKKRKEIK